MARDGQYKRFITEDSLGAEGLLPVCLIKQRTTSLFLFMIRQLCYSLQNKNFSTNLLIGLFGNKIIHLLCLEKDGYFKKF